jgi:hypothetical protein
MFCVLFVAVDICSACSFIEGNISETKMIRFPQISDEHLSFSELLIIDNIHNSHLTDYDNLPESSLPFCTTIRNADRVIHADSLILQNHPQIPAVIGNNCKPHSHQQHFVQL